MKVVKKPQFVKASGAPFSDEDVQLIGAELLKIAAANRVLDVRLLDKKIVFAAIEADPKHPLRRFYDWDVKSAARKHWINWTAKLIASVRIEWKIGKVRRGWVWQVRQRRVGCGAARSGSAGKIKG